MRRLLLLFVAVFTALLVSRELALSLPILGVGPDPLIIVVVVATAGEQPRTAAVGAFIAGFLRDLDPGSASPAGLSALAYALTAYAVALVGAVRGVWVYVGLVAGATFVSQVLYGLGAILLAQQADVGPLPRVVFVTTFYNTLLAPLLVPLLRRVVTPESAVTGSGS